MEIGMNSGFFVERGNTSPMKANPWLGESSIRVQITCESFLTAATAAFYHYISTPFVAVRTDLTFYDIYNKIFLLLIFIDSSFAEIFQYIKENEIKLEDTISYHLLWT